MYGTILFKKIPNGTREETVGADLIKFTGVKLPGGVELNGRMIYEDAQREIDYILEEMSSTYELPPLDMIG